MQNKHRRSKNDLFQNNDQPSYWFLKIKNVGHCKKQKVVESVDKQTYCSYKYKNTTQNLENCNLFETYVRYGTTTQRM